MEFNSKDMFTFFIRQKVFSIEVIEWWLLKYSQTFKKIVAHQKSRLKPYILDNGSIISLPPIADDCDKFSIEINKFIDLYNALETISNFHRNEKYFEQEIKEYLKIKSSNSILKKWVVRNEDLGANKYILFLVDYLDYSEYPEHLKVYVYTLKELNIYIERSDFKWTIEFLKVFNDLFWVQKIYPASSILKSVNEKMHVS